MGALLHAGRPLRAQDDPELFEQTVPRSLVHRAAVSEVLLTGRRSTPDAHHIGAQWSRGHGFYGVVDGRWHDPMVFGETLRQACLLLAHEALDVPMDFSFLTESTSFEVSEAGMRLSRPSGPAHVVFEMRLEEVKRRAGVVSSYAYGVIAQREGVRVGSGRLGGKCISPAVYRRLRADRLEAVPPRTPVEPVDPRLVGRDSAADVVLGASVREGARPLRIAAEHPVLFDHAVDHVPGMVLMEAARQAALLALGTPRGLLVACAARFLRYVEFDSPCLVSADPPEREEAGRRALTVRFHQDGTEVGSCRVAIHAADGE
ncbi:ScbA/BarX family gamma-butyrolactone biosynthesis protein [Streptomyces sp. CA-253872]|uniref:ScbA/BarX family gamma-butyrolactone biosynthesis protein n=1 Tax=Streptomyces sp. CA-253872 TaxID=3240067 RepID=UPI003D8EA807